MTNSSAQEYCHEGEIVMGRAQAGLEPEPGADLKERLSTYLDGELSANEAADVEAELAADPLAGAYLNDLKLLSNELGCDEADGRAANAIRAELRFRLAGRAPARNSAVRRWAWPSLAAAVALTALMTLRGPLAWQGQRATTDASITVEAVAQQYTLALDALGRPTP